LCPYGKEGDVLQYAVWINEWICTHAPLLPSLTIFFAGAQIKLNNMECHITEGRIIWVLLYILKILISQGLKILTIQILLQTVIWYVTLYKPRTFKH
jgi:hypothetical protein